jgi:hypothetical protein
MQKILFSLLALFIVNSNAKAQSSSEFPTTERLTMTAKNFTEVGDKLTAYISKEAFKTVSLYKTETSLTSNFILHESKLRTFDSLSYKYGKVTQLNLNSNDLDKKKADMQRYIDNTKTSIKSVEDQLEKIAKGEKPTYGSGSNSSSSERTLQNQLANYQRTLTNYENSMENYIKYENYVYVTLTLTDQKNATSSSSSYNNRNRNKSINANMPGVEYGFLWIENPKVDYSAKAYQSFAMKYNLKRNKGFFTVGIFKNADTESNDSSVINEMVFLNYGQQLYSQHWNNGNRAFLNPYVAYQAGLFLTNQIETGLNKIKPNVNMSLGLEIYKSKYFLLDNKLSYFMPIDTRNHDLRGMMYNVSVNFVF